MPAPPQPLTVSKWMRSGVAAGFSPRSIGPAARGFSPGPSASKWMGFRSSSGLQPAVNRPPRQGASAPGLPPRNGMGFWSSSGLQPAVTAHLALKRLRLQIKRPRISRRRLLRERCKVDLQAQHIGPHDTQTQPRVRRVYLQPRRRRPYRLRARKARIGRRRSRGALAVDHRRRNVGDRASARQRHARR